MRDVDGSIRAEMLTVAIECVLDLLGPGAYGRNLIAAERVNHDGFGTPRADFAEFFPIVAETYRDLCGDAWTAEIDRAWSQALARIAEISPA